MWGKKSKKTKGIENPPNPFDRHFPLKADTPNSTRMRIMMRRFGQLTVRNYATIPLLIVGFFKLSLVSVFSVYRLKTTPDVSIPHGDPEPWHKFEHIHAKFNPVDMEPVLREHPRPKFEYEVPRRQLKFRSFPPSAQYYWPHEKESHSSEEKSSKEPSSEDQSSGDHSS